jgi:phospholipid transport system transporter-binding protein
LKARLEVRGNGHFAVEGELSFATVPGLWDQSRRLFANAPKSMNIDLAAVERADSAGLALLVAWTRQGRIDAKSIRLINAPGQIMALAEANKLTHLLPLQAAR